MTLKKAKTRDIRADVRYLLWGRSAGRCEFQGCNDPLWKSTVTQEPVNVAQAAHIYAFSDDGPRGNSGIPEDQLNLFSNLLLVCHKCHKKIDKEKDGGRYPVELLREWKLAHETRVERVTGIDPDRKSHVVLYGRAINRAHSPLRFDRTSVAMFPHRYPAEDSAIELSISGSDSTERDAGFWTTEQTDLERKFVRKVGERLESGEIKHLSVFALAPMPLLIRLGTLLTDIREVDVYQLHRHPKGWAWPAETETIDLQIEKPSRADGAPALVIALSATIDDSRIHKVLGDNASIWRLTIRKPDQECIRSRLDLTAFSNLVRPLMNEIKAIHGHASTLSIFPAAPVSAMVELGRLRQPKADLDWILYDENRSLGGFVESLKIRGDHP